MIDSPLTSEDSLMAQNEGTTGYDFDTESDRGMIRSLHIKNASITSAKIQDAAITNAKIGTAAIGTANIGTLTFNQITGGTAILGGTANGNGVLNVLNESGGTAFILDKDDITINDSLGTQTIRIGFEDGLFQGSNIRIKPFVPTQGASFAMFNTNTSTAAYFEVESGSFFRVRDNIIIDQNCGLVITGTASQGAPDSNQAVIYVDNLGTSSKHRLMVRFGSGAAQPIAFEP